MPAPQSFKSHTRWDPPFHFFIMPMLLLNFIYSIASAIHTWPGNKHHHLWWIAMSFVLLLMAAVLRGAALRAQNRVIRVEEKLRLASLASPAELAELDSLAMPQYIALRFASNPEVVALARRAIREKLEPKQIKQAIVAWRPDYDRV